ncbi:MAG: hypothetical protein ACD_8C00124G0036 [uncultured bacterium]|nr:MAG: hypothetical protein ACD_8C00124G0036 [uncultured bacterium]
METKENSQSCCKGFGPKHKKVFVIGVAVIALMVFLLVIASVGWRMRQLGNGAGMMRGGDYSRCSVMAGYGNKYCPGPVTPDPIDQFVLPQDALMSGEIAVVVGDLESAKKAVADSSTKNGGSVYATFISYASKNLKKGSMVVQIPAVNFDKTFAELKKIGTQVIQESTQKIPANNFYYPMAATAADASSSVSAQEDVDISEEDQSPEAKPEIAIYPAPTQLAQDKGYIKIIFADYVTVGKRSEKNERGNFAGSFFGQGNSTSQNVKNNMFIVLGVKFIFLVASFGILFVLSKKIFKTLKDRKAKITKIHVVRQMTKINKRVVKIATKKKKKV